MCFKMILIRGVCVSKWSLSVCVSKWSLSGVSKWSGSLRGLLPILVSVVYNHPPLFLALGVQLLLCTGCRTRFQSVKPARDPSTSRPAAFEASLISWTKVHEWRVPPCWHWLGTWAVVLDTGKGMLARLSATGISLAPLCYLCAPFLAGSYSCAGKNEIKNIYIFPWVCLQSLSCWPR